MELYEIKQKVIGITTDVGALMPYDEEDLPDNWEAMSYRLAGIASTLAKSANSIAAYSSIARRKANTEDRG